MTSLRVWLQSGTAALLTLLSRTARAPVQVERLTLASPALGGERTVDVFLPADYGTDSTRGYAVLFVNDGQDMPGLGMKATLERLQARKAVPPFVVVAIHATGRRLMDYGTAGVTNAQGLGADADKYEQFMLNELMPLVNERYRLLPGATATAILGWSLGGLSAFDLAWRHPGRFGTVGAFSGAFWWRTDDSTVAARQVSRIMHRRVRSTPGHPALRIWFESGKQDETDDRDGNGVIDSIQDTDELMDELAAKGYRYDRDMVHLVVEGGHDLETWRRVLPEFLIWAFPPPPPP